MCDNYPPQRQQDWRRRGACTGGDAREELYADINHSLEQRDWRRRGAYSGTFSDYAQRLLVALVPDAEGRRQLKHAFQAQLVRAKMIEKQYYIKNFLHGLRVRRQKNGPRGSQQDLGGRLVNEDGFGVEWCSNLSRATFAGLQRRYCHSTCTIIACQVCVPPMHACGRHRLFFLRLRGSPLRFFGIARCRTQPRCVRARGEFQ